MINSEDMSYCYNFIQTYPKIYKFLSEENIFEGIKCNIFFSTRSQLSCFIILNKRIDTDYKTEFTDNLTFAKISFEIYNKSSKPFNLLPYSCLKILFRTENINTPILYCQYDSNKNESSYLLHYMYSNVQVPSKFTEYFNSQNIEKLQFFDVNNYIDTDKSISYYHKYGINSDFSYPSCYIFLIDQSGSMNNKPIKILRETLILFLKSLPFGSYFQIIGFGSFFEKYNKYPIKYSEENIDYMIQIISELKANLGGTNLYSSLEEVYNQSYSQEILNLSLNIIIITDGKVSNDNNV